MVTPTPLANSSEIWILTLVRIVLVVLAGSFTVVSYLAYRRERTRSLLGAIFGFVTITLGLMIEIAYEIAIKGSFFLTEAEVVRLQIVEGVFLVVGFAALLYSITQY